MGAMCVPSKNFSPSHFKGCKLEYLFFLQKIESRAALTFFAYEKKTKVFQNEKPHSSILKKPFKQARIAFYFVVTLL